MFKDKAYVCNLCRKVITYSPEQAGTTFPCPFCKTPVTLPSRWGVRAKTKTHTGLAWLVSLLLVAAAGAGAVWFWALPQAIAARSPQQGPETNCVTVAPAPAYVQGSNLTVAVTDVWYGCPQIHDSSIGTTETAQTPLYCVKLAVANVGKASVCFYSWREPLQSAAASKIKLFGSDGQAFSLVSYGSNTAPAGFRQQAEIAPGETLCDLVLFLRKEKPQSDLELTVPCENIGGAGQLCFRIPRDMVH